MSPQDAPPSRHRAHEVQPIFSQRQAQAIADQGRELYDRVLNVLGPIGDVGKHLDKSVEAYNKAVGSLETRLLPAAKRLKDVTAAEKDLPKLEPIDHAPRLPLELST